MLHVTTSEKMRSNHFNYLSCLKLCGLWARHVAHSSDLSLNGKSFMLPVLQGLHLRLQVSYSNQQSLS